MSFLFNTLLDDDVAVSDSENPFENDLYFSNDRNGSTNNSMSTTSVNRIEMNSTGELALQDDFVVMTPDTLLKSNICSRCHFSNRLPRRTFHR